MKKVCLFLLVALVTVLELSVLAAPAKDPTNINITKGKVFLNLKDADIKTVLQIFAKATNINVVAADDVTGKVTVTFSGISPKDGLEAVLRTKGLDWFEDHGTVFVSTKKIMRTYYLANARPSDISTTLTSILPSGSIVTADDSYNALVIQTTSDYLPRLEKLITELDVPPLQVMVEVRMIEISGGNAGTLGTDISFVKNSPNPNNVRTQNQTDKFGKSDVAGLFTQAMMIFTSGSLEAFVQAMATNTRLNVVATPRLTTLNNKPATILIGSKLGYKTSTVNQGVTSQVVNFLNVGTQLDLTPNVAKNGFIRMRIAPKISDGSIVDDLPRENTTETKNEVMVKDGQTFAIGGLIKEKENVTDYGIPFLMDIPVIGGIFRRTETLKEKVELIVFVTPHIVTPEYLTQLNQPITALEKKFDDNPARLIH